MTFFLILILHLVMMHATFDNVLIHCFQIFFTLTSGDLRWSANFTPELERQNCTVHYNVDELGKENVTVEVQNGKKTIEKPWQQYLRDHVDENLHAMMKRNVLLATRNFQHRVETFRKEVIFGQNNPMKVRHISYRVEFQGRGAAHIHGVLWLDLDELKVEGVNKYELKESYSKLKHSQPLESNEVRALEKFTDTFVTCTRCVSVAGAEAVKIAEETNWHGHSNSCRKGGARLCRWKFPRYPLERTIFVDANRDEVEPRLDAKVREEILDRVMRVLVQEEGGKKVLSKRVKKIMLSNRYPNVKEIGEEKTSASKEDEESDDSLQMSISAESQNLQQSLREDPSSEDEHPNTPSPRHFLPDDSSSLQIPISAETSTLQKSFPEDPSSQDQHPRTPSPRHYYPEDVLPLRNVISAEQPTLQQPSKPLPPHLPRKKSANPKTVTYVKMESPEEYKQNIRKRIDEVLKIASAGGTPITYKMYEKAVIEQPRKGSEVLLQRDIDEIFINNYNAEWIINWDANIDISPVYDYYGTITYITDYFTKVSSTIWKCLLVQPLKSQNVSQNFVKNMFKGS